MHLALGGAGSENPASFRVAEYAAYYRAVRQRFEAHAASPADTYPEPVEHCGVCEWQQDCVARRRADDHLSLVAGITRGQRARLAELEVTTMAALGALRLPVSPRLDGIGEAALARIREQARVQDQARREGRRIHEFVTPVEPDKGLAALPEPSDGDVFFDLEGDIFAADGGLEYLFGVVDRDGNYNPSWALDPASEKRVFERFIDDVMARWEQHPGFHIYHYGAYETTAVKRLMSCYATREDEVDRLLRGRVFVDLHRVVRQGLRASVESYSIKKLEPFYGFARAVDLATATRALIQAEARLESGNAAGVPDPLRTEIEGYNRDDCLSTLRLAAWLEQRRRELQALTGQPVPRPALRDEERDQEQETAVETTALFEALTAGLPVDDAELDDEQRARRLLAHLLEFHRREDKSMWWEFFHRCGFTEEEHVESRATLGALTCEGEAGQVKRSVIHRYRFPDQPHEVKVGDSPKNPDTAESDELKRGFCGTVVALDETGGTIDLKRGRSSPVPHPAALVPLDNVPNTVLRESLARLAEAVVSGGFAADSPRRAAFDLLGRVPPRIEPPASPPNASGFGVRDGLAAQGEAPLDAVQRIAPRLDRSVLPVQGPPGSGKTYTGARMILDLLVGGGRVGVTANSHKVISNLLAAVCDAADEPPVENGQAGGESDTRPARQAPVDIRGIQKANDGDGCSDERIALAGPNDEVAEALATGEANLAAGTAWLWGARGDGRHRGRPRRRRGGTDEPRQHPRRLPGGGEPRPARRSPPARPTHPGGPPARHRRLCPRPPPRRIGDRRPVPRRLPRPDVAHAPGHLRVHDGAVLRGAAPPPTGAPPADGGRAGAAGRARPALHSRGACRQHERLRRGVRMRRGADRRAARRRRGLGRPGGHSEAADAPGRPRRGPLQRARRGPAVDAVGRRPGGYGRQVPGTGGADRDLLDGDLERRRSAAGDGVPLQPAPPQRRHLARPLRGRDRRQPNSPHPGLPHPGADAPGQPLLPLPRAGAAGSRTRAPKLTDAPLSDPDPPSTAPRFDAPPGRFAYPVTRREGRGTIKDMADPTDLLRQLTEWAERMGDPERKTLSDAIDKGDLSVVVEGIQRPVAELPTDARVQVSVDRHGGVEWVSVPRGAAPERPEGADELTEVLSDALDRLVPARRVAIAKCPECERETGP